MDGQKVRMVMGLCLLRIITMVTRASCDGFNGEPRASCCGAAGVLWQGHDLRPEAEAKMITPYWNKGLPVKLQSQMLSPRILQGQLSKGIRTGHPEWDQQPEILWQFIDTKGKTNKQIKTKPQKTKNKDKNKIKISMLLKMFIAATHEILDSHQA